MTGDWLLIIGMELLEVAWITFGWLLCSELIRRRKEREQLERIFRERRTGKATSRSFEELQQAGLAEWSTSDS